MQRLRIATLNIWNKSGPWPRRLPRSATSSRVSRPTSSGCRKCCGSDAGDEPSSTPHSDQASEIADGLGYQIAFGSAADYASGLQFGNAVLSRHPILSHQNFALPGAESGETRALLHARIATPFGELPMFVTHLNWKLHHGSVRLSQVRFIAQRIFELAPIDESKLPAGAGRRFQAPDGAGGFIVSWHDERSFDEEVFTQRFDAAGATQFQADGLASFNNPGVQVGPLLLQTPDGGTLAVWNEKRSGRYDIRARKLNDDGTPAGPATLVCDAPGNQIVFALVDDGAGGGIVGWTDFVFGNEKLYVQRIDGNGTPLWDAIGVAVCGAPGNQETPQMIPDGAGGAIVTWTDLRNPIDPDIYAQRINASGVIQWGLNGASVCTASEMQTGPGVAPDGAGGAIIAWNDRRFLTPAIMAQRLDAAGAPQWTVNGVEIANFSFSGWPATVSGAVSDGSGGTIFLLNQLSYTFVTYVPQNALLLQRIDGSGVRQWGTNGSTVCDAIGRLAYERLIGDGTGGAFVAWSDERSSTSDIYAQHVNSGGSAAWNANGNVVCDAIAWQSLGGITRAPGALLLSWTDYRSGHADVYAQRVDDTGSAVWSTNGVVVSNAIRGQHLATLAPWKSASPERLFVGWTDDRSGNARNVMVQRLDLSGAPQWAGDGVTGTEVALVSAEASAQRVRLVWYSSANVTATVYRRTESASWSALGVASTDGSGQITFEDPDVVPGERYAYRLGIRDGAAEVFARETWVEVPRALELSLEGLRPNPAVRDIAVTFTLPQGDDARIEWLDVTGRRVRTQSLVGLSPGRHTLRLAGAPPAPGVYLLVLTQGDRTVTARGAIIR